MPRHHFISYSNAEAADFAQHLHNALEAEGIPAWLDKRNLKAGINSDIQISDGIALPVYNSGMFDAKCMSEAFQEQYAIPGDSMIAGLDQLTHDAEDKTHELVYIIFNRQGYASGTASTKNGPNLSRPSRARSCVMSLISPLPTASSFPTRRSACSRRRRSTVRRVSHATVGARDVGLHVWTG